MEVTVKIPQSLAARAESSGVPPSVFVERLLNRIEEIAQQNVEREKLRTDLKADWDHFQSTGLHLDHEEVDAWLASLERGQNPELPELHV